ncbi:putative terminase large subunit [Enterococcus phage vB_EfaH_EF1TV]|nr:putative terminase large subunit [Enterococcus phage vB_EfaH_EF1TV]
MKTTVDSTNEQMTKFVQTRLDPVLQNGYYSTIVDQEVNSLKAKKIRNSFLYFRSSSKPGAVEGVDIDYLSMDEYDRVPALAEASALESMSSSPYKIVNRWSTPSAPDMGIHGLFKGSDQHWYLHKCEKCNYYNEMSYDAYTPEAPVESRGNILCVNPKGVDVVAKTVVDGSFQFVCQKCGEPLDRWYNGVWVPKYPDRTKNGLGTRGYMISQMNAVWVTADQLKTKELQSLSKQAFYNYTLGE